MPALFLSPESHRRAAEDVSGVVVHDDLQVVRLGVRILQRNAGPVAQTILFRALERIARQRQLGLVPLLADRVLPPVSAEYGDVQRRDMEPVALREGNARG